MSSDSAAITPLGVTQDQFGGSTADVGHQVRTGHVAVGQPAGRAAETQLGLLGTRDDVRLDAEPLARSRRRTRPGCSRPAPPRSPRTASASHPGCPDHRGELVARPRTPARSASRSEGSGRVDPLPEPDDRHPPVDLDQLTVEPDRRSAGGSSSSRSRPRRPALRHTDLDGPSRPGLPGPRRRAGSPRARLPGSDRPARAGTSPGSASRRRVMPAISSTCSIDSRWAR